MKITCNKLLFCCLLLSSFSYTYAEDSTKLPNFNYVYNVTSSLKNSDAVLSTYSTRIKGSKNHNKYTVWFNNSFYNTSALWQTGSYLNLNNSAKDSYFNNNSFAIDMPRIASVLDVGIAYYDNFQNLNFKSSTEQLNPEANFDNRLDLYLAYAKLDLRYIRFTAIRANTGDSSESVNVSKGQKIVYPPKFVSLTENFDVSASIPVSFSILGFRNNISISAGYLEQDMYYRWSQVQTDLSSTRHTNKASNAYAYLEFYNRTNLLTSSAKWFYSLRVAKAIDSYNLLQQANEITGYRNSLVYTDHPVDANLSREFAKEQAKHSPNTLENLLEHLGDSKLSLTTGFEYDITSFLTANFSANTTCIKLPSHNLESNLTLSASLAVSI